MHFTDIFYIKCNSLKLYLFLVHIADEMRQTAEVANNKKIYLYQFTSCTFNM